VATNQRWRRAAICIAITLVVLSGIAWNIALHTLTRVIEIHSVTFEVRECLKCGPLVLYCSTHVGPLGKEAADEANLAAGEWLTCSEKRADANPAGLLPYHGLDVLMKQVDDYWIASAVTQSRRKNDRTRIREILRKHRTFRVEEDGIHENRHLYGPD